MRTLDDIDGRKLSLNVITSIITLFVLAVLIFNCVKKKKTEKKRYELISINFEPMLSN